MKEQDPEFAMGQQFEICPLPRTMQEVRERHEANRIGWNEGAVVYTRHMQESIDFLQSGASSLHPIERANLNNLGPLRDWCQTAIHLQCASGRDTISLWNEGVPHIVGVDISEVHIENARQVSAALGVPATWHCCDVLDTPHLLDGSADMVYTGRGALCWIQDLVPWGKVIARLLKPGGILHLFDDHPVAWLFNPDAETLVASGLDYFRHSEVSRGWPETYIGNLGKPTEQHAAMFERLWPISMVFHALRHAGLVIDHLGEHPETYWCTFPNLRRELRGQIPMTFSMMARRPG
jgi:SAM-dependent methyltransferase